MPQPQATFITASSTARKSSLTRWLQYSSVVYIIDSIGEDETLHQALLLDRWLSNQSLLRTMIFLQTKKRLRQTSPSISTNSSCCPLSFGRWLNCFIVSVACFQILTLACPAVAFLPLCSVELRRKVDSRLPINPLLPSATSTYHKNSGCTSTGRCPNLVQVLAASGSRHEKNNRQPDRKTSKGTTYTQKNPKKAPSDNVESLVVKMGLTPVSSGKMKDANPKAKGGTRDPQNSCILRDRPTLQTQLDYARNGHAVLRKYLNPAKLQQIRQELEEYGRQNELLAWRQKVEVATGNHSPKLLADCDTIEDCIQELNRLGISWERLPFLQYFNAWRKISSIKKLADNLAETASILLDVPSVRLYQDSFFWKRSNDGPTPWHTDARMAPFDTSNILTFWIPLHDISPSGSALHFVSKSHADFALPFWNPYDDEKEDDGFSKDSPWSSLEERYQHHKIVNYMPLSLGDMTIHSGWTLHCADSQDSSSDDEDRLALAITYVDARAPIRKGVLSKEDHGDDEDQWSYSDWVKEVPAGKPFHDHPLVPIVWPPQT